MTWVEGLTLEEVMTWEGHLPLEEVVLLEVILMRSRMDLMVHYSLEKETRTTICYFIVHFLVFAISKP